MSTIVDYIRKLYKINRSSKPGQADYNLNMAAFWGIKKFAFRGGSHERTRNVAQMRNWSDWTCHPSLAIASTMLDQHEPESKGLPTKNETLKTT